MDINKNNIDLMLNNEKVKNGKKCFSIFKKRQKQQ
jgi:hypothetical protein